VTNNPGRASGSNLASRVLTFVHHVAKSSNRGPPANCTVSPRGHGDEEQGDVSLPPSAQNKAAGRIAPRRRPCL